MKLFFDTETTGLVNWSVPFDQQTIRMVQLGMILTDNDLNTLQEVGLIIYPDNYAIPEQASNIHGITTDIARFCGISSEMACNLFHKLSQKASMYIGHNIKFDKAVIASEMRCHSPIKYQEQVTYCTMLESTSICKLKGTRGYKWPKLSEAYQYFFNETLHDAHDALTDVRATVRIYKELMNKKQSNPTLVMEDNVITTSQTAALTPIP